MRRPSDRPAAPAPFTFPPPTPDPPAPPVAAASRDQATRPGPVLRASRPFDASHPTALAVYCSDGRFTDAVEDLLHQRGEPRLDVVCVPGGPALLSLGGAAVAETDTLRRGTQFLVEGHRIRHVALIAHEGCGFYRARYAQADAAQLRATQVKDLRAAGRWLADAHAGLRLELFFALVRDGHIEFEPLALLG